MAVQAPAGAEAAASGAAARAPWHRRGPFAPTWFGPAAALGLLAGVLAVQGLVRLPPLPGLLGLAGVGALGLALLPRWRPLAWCLLGFAWAAWRADAALQQRLPRELEGQDVVVVGRVVDLPRRGEDSLRFALRVQQARVDAGPLALSGTLRLAWYDAAPALAPCETWQLRLRLKRPRALLNPGGFDAERHALEQGIVASGYVRDDAANVRLGAASCIDGLRARLSTSIASRLGDDTVTRLLRALAVGDQGDLDAADWQVLRATGVGHLVAISGLHVGLLALVGALLARALWKLVPRLGLWLPGPLVEAPAGLVCAGAYAALAGFGLPTTRTLLMIAVLALARAWRRALSPAQGLALAAMAILLVDPLAVLSAGFWLSFLGVALLMLALSCTPRGWWRELAGAQGAMSLGLLPLSVWFFGQGSLVGPLANLLAVPFVSFVVVPLTLAGTALLLPLPAAGGVLLGWAHAALQAQWWLLQRLAALPGAQWWLPEPTAWAFVLALLGAVWLLLPKGVPLRWAGVCLFLPLLWPTLDRPRPGEADVTVLDVGQGLAVLVSTARHHLVYDTGARYPSGFDLGEAAVVPAAHALGVGRIDRLVLSHADNDHAGGAAAVVSALAPARVDSGEPQRVSLGAGLCRVGEGWEWDGVRFRMLGPVDPESPRPNDRSCVLAVEAHGARLLLTGDIGMAAEPAIAAALGPGPPPVLLVPHHGSKGSSGAGLLDALRPPLALVSAGYRSRFGHPHAQTLQRYAERGIPVANTAEWGCLRLRLGSAGVRWLERCRALRQAYWREP